jgi:hypothetical protein
MMDALQLEQSEAEIAEVFGRARRAGDPHWLWPDVQRIAWQCELENIESATRSILEGRSCELQVADRAPFAVAAHTSGMGPLLGYWIEAGRLRADADASELLLEHLSHGRKRMRLLSQELSEVCALLEEADVRAQPVKGMHTAFAYFPDAGTRPVADIDLLVSDARLTSSILQARGYIVHQVQHRPAKTEFRKAGAARLPRSLLLTHAEDPVAIDVHSSLERNFFGVARVRIPEELLATQHGQLLFLATHASEGLHNLRMIRLVELVLVANSGGIDWRLFLESAHECNALKFSYPALQIAERLVPGTVPAFVLEAGNDAVTPAMRRVVEELRPANAQAVRSATNEERWMWAATPGERLRRGLHLLWPAPAGASARSLAQIYGSRFWRMFKGRVQ